MSVKFWETIVRSWFFLSYLINTVNAEYHLSLTKSHLISCDCLLNLSITVGPIKIMFVQQLRETKELEMQWLIWLWSSAYRGGILLHNLVKSVLREYLQFVYFCSLNSFWNSETKMLQKKWFYPKMCCFSLLHK